jgi:hypothetical protein
VTPWRELAPPDLPDTTGLTNQPPGTDLRNCLIGRSVRSSGRANGSGAKLRGQGLRAEAEAARRMPACESRDAGGVTPSRLH